MFSRWKLQIKTEQRKFSINPFEKNQEAGIGSFFEIKKKKIITTGKARLEAFWPNDKSKWSDNNWRGEGGRWKTILSVFLPISSGNANLTKFQYSTLHSLDSVDAFDTWKYFTRTLYHYKNLTKMMMKLILKIKSPIVRLLMTREQTWPPSNPFRRTLHFVHWTFSHLVFFFHISHFAFYSDYFDMLSKI